MPDAEHIANALRRLAPHLPDEPIEALARQVEALAGPHMRGRREQTLMAEVEEMARVIETMRREFGETPIAELSSEHLNGASDHLDAIAAQTMLATETILSACEVLDHLPGVGDIEAVRRTTARIYEACSFQDVVGQRIGKVLAAIKVIEDKVGAIRDTFAYDLGTAALLAGPPLPSDGIDQNAVDRLMADF